MSEQPEEKDSSDLLGELHELIDKLMRKRLRGTAYMYVPHVDGVAKLQFHYKGEYIPETLTCDRVLDAMEKEATTGPASKLINSGDGFLSFFETTELQAQNENDIIA